VNFTCNRLSKGFRHNFKAFRMDFGPVSAFHSAYDYGYKYPLRINTLYPDTILNLFGIQVTLRRVSSQIERNFQNVLWLVSAFTVHMIIPPLLPRYYLKSFLILSDSEKSHFA